MQTRSSLVFLTLLPWVATTSFFIARRIPMSFWLDLWPILPFIATALGGLFLVVSNRDGGAGARAARTA
jgi:hypothetical protein